MSVWFGALRVCPAGHSSVRPLAVFGSTVRQEIKLTNDNKEECDVSLIR